MFHHTRLNRILGLAVAFLMFFIGSVSASFSATGDSSYFFPIKTETYKKLFKKPKKNLKMMESVTSNTLESSATSYIDVFIESSELLLQDTLYPDTTDKPKVAKIPSGSLPPPVTTGDLTCLFDQKANPSMKDDQPVSVINNGTDMFVVGYDRLLGSRQWRIHKHDFKTGALNKAFGFFKDGIITEEFSPGNDIAYDIAADANYIYIVGADSSPRPNAGVDSDWQWRIEKRDIVTGNLVNGFGNAGIVVSNPSKWDDEPLGIAIDQNYMYVVGFDSVGLGNFEWRIEKRLLATGALVNDFGPNKDGVVTSDITNVWDLIKDVAIDGNAMYLVGNDGFDPMQAPTDGKWHIEKRDLKDGSLIPVFGDQMNGIQISNPSNDYESPQSIAIDQNYMYIAGYDRVEGGWGQWRIEKRSLVDAKLDAAFGNGGVIQENPSGAEDVAISIAIDTDFMYVVGYDEETNWAAWRIEKRKLVDGSLDPAFANQGIVRFDPSMWNDAATGVTIGDKCIRVVGYDSTPAQNGTDIQWRILGGRKGF